MKGITSIICKASLALFLCVFAILNQAQAQTNSLTYKKQDGRLQILMGDQEILGYQYEHFPAPDGVDPSYGRSGFMHPVNTPSGKLLTWIQPKDHYHHYGIWNPWTHLEYRGDTLDFWNLNSKKGYVEFDHFENIEKRKDGSIAYSVVHNHVKTKGVKETILKEVQNVVITKINDNSYAIDLESVYTCTTPYPFNILEYRYAGLGWRCTEEWKSGNCSVLTSAGLPRTGSDGTRAKWMIGQGSLGEGSGGILLMSDPHNYNHVAGEGEPIRVWPEQGNNGHLFLNFSPTKTTDWKMMPGLEYKLRYRLLVFDGSFDANQAAKAYQAYTN